VLNLRVGTSLVAGALVLALAGCGNATDSNADGQDAQAVAAGVTLTCQKLSVLTGSIGSGQSAAALATAQLTNKQDVWKDYVEFSPKTSAVCTYPLPSGMDPASITGLKLQVNYRGPAKSQMVWTFQGWSTTTDGWTAIGDNGFARDWVWTSDQMTFPGPVSQYISGGQIQILYETTSNVDASDVDQLVVIASVVNPDAGGAIDAGLLADAGTGGGVDAGGSGSTDAGSQGETDAGAGPDAGQPVDAGSSADAGQPVDAGSPADAGGSSGQTSYWKPPSQTSWQIEISNTVDTSFNVAAYDIDLFDNAAAVMSGLHAQGRKVICYFSAGSYENWRPDASAFPASVLGSPLQGWPGEWWLDIRSPTVRSIMEARLDLAVQKGCDAVDPDNVDEYTNSNGLGLTAADQLDYNEFIANAAHARNLAVGLKNDTDQIPQLIGYYEFTVNEQCFDYNECNTLTPFISANKPVFQIEYGSTALANTDCPKAKALGFETLIKDMNLDATTIFCP
jgi:hypothetical protein